MNLASEIRRLANAATCAVLRVEDHGRAVRNFADYMLRNATAIADALEENERLKAHLRESELEIATERERADSNEAQLAAKDGLIEEYRDSLKAAALTDPVKSVLLIGEQGLHIKRLQRELAEAREWISVYGSHTATCETTKSLTNPRPCDCGLDTFRAKEKA